MNTMPIIQNFFGTPVRFFKTEFELRLGGYDTPPIIQSYGIPFPDFCKAIKQEEKVN